MTKEELLAKGLSEEDCDSILKESTTKDERIKQLEAENKTLAETNNNLSTSEAGLKVRVSELEKQYKEVYEKSHESTQKSTDIFEAIVNANKE